MKKYILIRFLKSILSILIVVSIVVGMVYKLVPTDKIFENDEAFRKLRGNPKRVYELTKLRDQGYLKYYSHADLCKMSSSNYEECMKVGSEENKRVFAEYEKNGYTIEVLEKADQMQGQIVAFKYLSFPVLIKNYMSKLVVLDHPWYIKDENNPDLPRHYKIERGPNGIPALACSGCDYKYQLYIDGNFPFLHQNFFHLRFGESFPSHPGLETLDVISRGQGKMKKVMQTFPTGLQAEDSRIQYSRRYKFNPDHLDKKRFDDNYANVRHMTDAPSMISTSYFFGICAVLLAYAVGFPAGMAMARNKDKLVDKVGIAYINLMIAVPSLAFIFFMNFLGYQLGLPDKFPQLGFHNVKSYVMPIIILAMLGTPSLMTWIRRYMVDQSNADYVKFAKAKGLSKREISRKHILKNAVVPIVSGIPGAIILAIGGAFITETIFAIPGMGKMLPDSIGKMNNNMVVTLTFIFSTLAIFATFLGDILMTIVDPRISLSTKKGD